MSKTQGTENDEIKFSMESLGVMKKHDKLRVVWPHEAHHFTKWLAREENLAMLGNILNFEIKLQEQESAVGAFSADIFATEVKSGKKIIIENQLEQTDHSHLGQIITYASGKEAEIIIWIVKEAREEHQKSIEWLNNNTPECIGFFLLEIELWTIGESSVAPKFNIVEKPNNWAKTIKTASPTEELYYQFWDSFNKFALKKENFQSYRLPKPAGRNWCYLNSLSSFYKIELTVRREKQEITAGIFIDDSKELFERIKLNAKGFEHDISNALDSTNKFEWISEDKTKSSRILLVKKIDSVFEEKKWDEYFKWFCDYAEKFRTIAKKYEDL